MTRPAFLIPGGSQHAGLEPYRRIGAMLEERGFAPIGVPVDWTRPGLVELISDTSAFIRGHDPAAAIIGFSFGAVFAPSAVGSRTASAVASTSGPWATATLIGQGNDPGDPGGGDPGGGDPGGGDPGGAGLPVLTADPNPAEFGSVDVGLASAAQTITVTNVGDGSGEVGTTLDGPHPDDFFVQSNDCVNATLVPGASCTMDVIFIPGGDGDASSACG